MDEAGEGLYLADGRTKMVIDFTWLMDERTGDIIPRELRFTNFLRQTQTVTYLHVGKNQRYIYSKDY